MSTVYFGGSRSLPQNTFLPRVVSAVLAAGHSINVGCAIGTDEQVIQSLICSSSFSQARVFAAFAQSSAGIVALPVVGTLAFAFAVLPGKTKALRSGRPAWIRKASEPPRP